jgi:hypothetical protein
MTLERAFHPIETIARLKLQQHPKGGGGNLKRWRKRWKGACKVVPIGGK